MNQPAAYFLMPSRFWEMAAGCLIFIGFQKRASVEQLLEKVPTPSCMAVIVGMYLPMSLAAVSTVGGCLVVHPDRLQEADSSIQGLHQSQVVYVGLISTRYIYGTGVCSRSVVGLLASTGGQPPGRADAGSSDCFVSMDRDTTTQGQLVGEAMEDLMVGGGVGNSIWRTFCSCQNTKREILREVHFSKESVNYSSGDLADHLTAEKCHKNTSLENLFTECKLPQQDF